MCNEQNHANLSQPEHFTRHTMKVEQKCALARRAFDRLSVDDMEHAAEDAREALSLADGAVSKECVHMLQLVLQGDMQTAAKL